MSRTLVAALVVGAVVAASGLALSRLIDTSQPAQVRSATVSDDGRSLVIRYVRSAETCGGRPIVSSSETGSQVTVTVEIRKKFRLGEQACPAIGKYATAVVPLSEVLGDRSVVDGHSGEEVPVVQAPES